MPPKKEIVVYPASKRKGPAFKPQRPSKVPRVASTESESSRPNPLKIIGPIRKRPVIEVQDDDDDDVESSDTASGDDSNSDEDLDDNPLASKAKKTKTNKPSKPAPAKRKPPREVSPMSVTSQQSSNNLSPDRPPESSNLPPPPSQLDGPPPIPQPLLVRLLHEHFADKNTKIDKQAIQVLQKYFELFIRESIFRAHGRRKELVEQMGADAAAERGVDAKWLEYEDLEKIYAGVLLDF